ncbi:MAG TPA: hypothetical protein VK543_03675 [Puia sp.]|nr:hypothetical protein [Puia sp.]
MKTIFVLFLSGMLLCVLEPLQAQVRKFDSTLINGKVGYRVSTNNKNIIDNEVQVKLIGFDKSSHGFDFFIRGKVVKAELEDLNNDGFTDLLIYVYSGKDGEFGNVYAFASEENKTVSAFSLPDVMLDGKLKTGYKGHDEFSLMEGTLMQKFPLYKPGDEADKPTGGSRVVQYQAAKGEDGRLKFKVLRSYDVK